MLETQKLQEKETGFWEGLVHTLHFLDIKLLEWLYLPELTTTYFKELLNRLQRYNIKRDAVRNRIKKLEKLGLIETVNGGILVINSIPQIADNVRKLILCWKHRWGE